MSKLRERISLVILAAVYFLCSFRYYAGDWPRSLAASLVHLLDTVPYAIGLAILIVVFLQKVLAGRLPWDRIIRIYLTIGIIIEFFFGLHDYLTP